MRTRRGRIREVSVSPGNLWWYSPDNEDVPDHFEIVDRLGPWESDADNSAPAG